MKNAAGVFPWIGTVVLRDIRRAVSLWKHVLRISPANAFKCRAVRRNAVCVNRGTNVLVHRVLGRAVRIRFSVLPVKTKSVSNRRIVLTIAAAVFRLLRHRRAIANVNLRTLGNQAIRLTPYSFLPRQTAARNGRFLWAVSCRLHPMRWTRIFSSSIAHEKRRVARCARISALLPRTLLCLWESNTNGKSRKAKAFLLPIQRLPSKNRSMFTVLPPFTSHRKKCRAIPT